ncbi:MAG: type II toxin-antitoxin system PemK/MazF family toxin, partial [Trebonia sp.]
DQGSERGTGRDRCVVTCTGCAPIRTPPAASSAARGTRYAVAIQSDGILLSALIVAPTSTSAQPAVFRPEIEMEGTQTRVLVDQMRAVDASRLVDFAGRLDAAEAGKVDRAVRLILGVL